VAGRTARLWLCYSKRKEVQHVFKENEAAFQLVFFYVRQLHTAAPVMAVRIKLFLFSYSIAA